MKRFTAQANIFFVSIECYYMCLLRCKCLRSLSIFICLLHFLFCLQSVISSALLSLSLLLYSLPFLSLFFSHSPRFHVAPFYLHFLLSLPRALLLHANIVASPIHFACSKRHYSKKCSHVPNLCISIALLNLIYAGNTSICIELLGNNEQREQAMR